MIDVLCAPGHKGLLGPQGTGLLLLRRGLCPTPLIEGGSGVHSLESGMPEELPERLEAGTLPTPALAGLCEGIRFLQNVGLSSVMHTEHSLNRYLKEQLLDMPGVTVYAAHHTGPTLLFSVEGLTASEVGDMLNRQGICVRAGYHCAALGHKTLATPAGGAVRISPGFFNTRDDMDAVVAAVYALTK